MGPEAKAWFSAHAVVVSRQTMPFRVTDERIAQRVENLPWSWISAGVERQQRGSRRESKKYSLLDAGAPGLVAGRHKALEACKEDIIIYLDDDVTLPAGGV